MKNRKNKKKTPAYTALLTAAAFVFALLIVVLSVVNASNDGKDTEKNDQTTNSCEDSTSYISDTTEKEIESSTDFETDSEKDETTALETEPPAPEQTVPVGIYVETSNKKYTSVTEYSGKWPENDSDKMWKLDTWTYPGTENLICDVEYFAVFTSDESAITLTYWDETWTERWNDNVNDDKAKIGFEFTVCLKNGEKITANVLGPSDTFALEKYFELYLYDCVAHAHDRWYSHITEKTCYDDTQNVMIKITLRNGCYDVDEILMTAFVYTPDELDENGSYIGANKATCVVKRG